MIVDIIIQIIFGMALGLCVFPTPLYMLILAGLLLKKVELQNGNR